LLTAFQPSSFSPSVLIKPINVHNQRMAHHAPEMLVDEGVGLGRLLNHHLRPRRRALTTSRRGGDEGGTVEPITLLSGASSVDSGGGVQGVGCCRLHLGGTSLSAVGGVSEGWLVGRCGVEEGSKGGETATPRWCRTVQQLSFGTLAAIEMSPQFPPVRRSPCPIGSLTPQYEYYYESDVVGALGVLWC
jgi:hypothetical protein